MMQGLNRKIGFACVYLTVAVSACSTYLWAQSRTSEQRAWQKRGLETADNPKAARVAIIEAIYARRIVSLAQGYELAVQRKPTDPVRIANFAHAARWTNEFSRHEEEVAGTTSALIERGYWALKPIMERDPGFPPWATGEQQHDMAEEHSAMINRTHGRFTPTNVPDAWLSWYYRGANGEEGHTQAIQYVLTRDPKFAEAYLARAENDIVLYSRTHRSAYLNDATQSLHTAETLEPRLHTLCLRPKRVIDLTLKNYKQASVDEQEYLRSWPNKEGAEVMRQDRERLQKTIQRNKDQWNSEHPDKKLK